MFKKLALITTIILFSAFSANAGSDGELILKKNQPNEVKDCVENLNRATFALNQSLDKAIIKPIAKGYRKLPDQVQKGTENVVNNLSNLITIPNNVLQGDLGLAGKNTSRLLINSTLGILGLFDPASHIGLNNYENLD